MALLDKVKAQAQDVAKKAQEAGRAGQAKLDDLQQRRKLDGLYRDLGEAYYANQAGEGSDAQMASAVTAVKAQLDAMSDEDESTESTGDSDSDSEA